MTRPFLSVIVPAHQSSRFLPETLEALVCSRLPRDCWELIVVDDASTDETSFVAARYADTLVRLAGNPYGPAYARNRGVEVSRGEVIVFVDADICVHSDSLRRFAVLFAKDSDLGAAFGSYDTRPRSPGLVSQYRNLLHHYVHNQNAGEAETFWAGLGAVRRSALIGVGMFDEWHYPRPQIEDIELGRRLRQHGYRILLDPGIQGTHLKRWTLRDVLKTDFGSRGVPWMWLMLQEGMGAAPSTLNLRLRERVSTILMASSLLGVGVAAVWRSPWPLVGTLAAVAVVLALNARLYEFMRRRKGFAFALGVMPLHMLYYLTNIASAVVGWLQHILFGKPDPPASTVAFTSLGLKTWPPVPKRLTSSLWDRQAGGGIRAKESPQ